MSNFAMVLVVYMLGVAYILWRFLAWLKVIARSLRGWWASRRASGKIILLTRMKRKPISMGILISLTGWLTGSIMMIPAIQSIETTRLLLLLLFVAVVLEEIRLPRRKSNLLKAMTLVAAFRSENADGKDTISILTDSLHDLPPGEVKAAVQESLYLHRENYPIEECLYPLRKANPFLDELALNLDHAGWRTGPAMDLALDTLLQRARRKWSRYSQALRFRVHAQPYIILGRGAVLSGMLLILVSKLIPSFSPDILMQLPWWLHLSILGMLLTLQFVFTNRWMRSASLAGFLIMGVIPFVNPYLPLEGRVSSSKQVTHLPAYIPETWLPQKTMMSPDKFHPVVSSSKPLDQTANSSLSCINVSGESAPSRTGAPLTSSNDGPFLRPSQTPSLAEESWRIELSQPK
jgi:hypothetical protein